VPSWLGLASENAAHRIAVEWEQDGERREGVFIPRRDTSSSFNATFGGRVFPGIFQRSTFDSSESSSAVSVRIVHADGSTEISFAGHVADAIPSSSIFPTLDEAAGFFSLGATGYSATHAQGRYHGMELECLDWTIAPLAIDEAVSAFFGDGERFPEGSAVIDCALIMRGIPHRWHSRPDLFLSAKTNALTTHREEAV
jgi:hypothetical protein